MKGAKNNKKGKGKKIIVETTVKAEKNEEKEVEATHTETPVINGTSNGHAEEEQKIASEINPNKP
jgi:hypothetical protein